MFRNAKILILASAMVLIAGAIGTSALTAVIIDRDLTVSLKADNDNNVAVKIACIDNTLGGGPNYSALCTYDGNGILAMDLHKVLNSGGTIGFNRNASFQIGADAAARRVVAVTNNSAVPIKVYFNSTGVAMKTEAGVSLTAAPLGTSDTVGAGTTKEFYYIITTPNDGSVSLSGTLQIRE